MSYIKEILKNDGIFIYEDYLDGRSVRRLSELDSDVTQSIRRTSNGAVKAVLVSKAYWDGKVAAYAAALVAFPVVSIDQRTDDYLGNNLSVMIDLLDAHHQTPELLKRVNAEGSTNAASKVFSVIRTQEFFEDSKLRAGDPKADLDGKQIGGV